MPPKLIKPEEAIANRSCTSFCNQPKSHFGLLPWVRPWDNCGKCYMDGKSIQCWSNAWQHIPIYLQPFTSYCEILVGNCNFFLPPLHLMPPFKVFPLEFVETTVLAIAHEWFEWIISPTDCAPVTERLVSVLNVEQNCLFTTDDTVTATYSYRYLLQLNKTTCHSTISGWHLCLLYNMFHKW